MGTVSTIFKNIKRKINNQKAQSAIEIGLVLPVILILVLGSFDIAKICTTYLDLNSTLTYNLGELMKDNKPGAQGRWVQAMKTDFEKESIFKATINIERIGPFPPGSRNTTGTVWCVDGTAQIPVTYAQLFGGETAKISKRVCSLQEVSQIQ